MSPKALGDFARGLRAACGTPEPKFSAKWPVRVRLRLGRLGQNRLDFPTRGVTVPLREELEVVRLYLEIEHMRFTQRLSFAIHCSVDDDKVLVPGLMIQTLVDNAIKHGIARSASGGSVTVAVQAVEGPSDDVVIEVVNSGWPLGSGPEDQLEGDHAQRGAPEGSGTGLDNVRRRIVLLWGPRAKLSLFRRDDGLTVARVVIPGGGTLDSR